MMSDKSVFITVGTLEEMGKEFISAWHDAESGKTSKAPVEKIYFNDENLFFKTLTPARFNLLKKLHELGKSSIRALSKELKRDYKNVYDDVVTLNKIDLILKDQDSKYYVPWESIITEISMETKKPVKIRKHHPKNNRGHSSIKSRSYKKRATG